MIQKILATLMTYSISFQLILGGIPLAYLTSAEVHAAGSCAQGLEWNSILNRCLTTRQAAQVQSASSRCFKIQDKASQTKCFNDSIDAQVKDEEDKIGAHAEVKGAFSSFGSGVSILLSMASIYGSASAIEDLSSCPAATSAWIMAGGAVAVLAGEVMSGHTYKKKIASYKKDFEKMMSGQSAGGPSEIQSESINVMIKKEEATLSAAKLKNNLYKVATAAYSAAAVMAIYEMIKEKTFAGVGTTCVSKSEEAEKAKKAKAKKAEDENATKDAKNSSDGSGTGSGGGGDSKEKIEDKTKADAADGAKPDAKGGSTGKTNNDHLKSKLKNSKVAHIDTNLNDFYSNEVITNKFSEQKTLDYLSSYFEKKINVSFNEYYKASSVMSSRNWNEYYFSMSELKSYRDGEVTSASLDDYERIKRFEKNLFINTSVDEFTLMKLATRISEEFMIKDAHAIIPFGALGMILGLGAIGVAGAMVFEKASQKVASLYRRPITRLALSAVMITNNIFMIKHTGKAIDTAKKRKEFLENLKIQVEAAGTGFGSCEEKDRSDMSKPQCYCYLSGGTINTARVKSNICKKFFGAGLAQNANKPQAISNAREDRTCTAANSTVLDPSCSCRKTNSCTTIPKAGFTSTGVPPSAIGNINRTIDGLNNGSLDGASIDAAKMNELAAALQKKKSALLGAPQNKDIALKASKAEKAAEQLMRNLGNTFANTPSLMNGVSGMTSSPGVGDISSPEDAVKKLQEDFKKDMSQYEPGTVGAGGNTLGSINDDFSLDATIGGGVTVDGDEKLAEVMDTNFEATGSDINSNSDANIFQILTYRYQRSAMRRLFGGEAMLPADKPSETEISE